MTNSQKKCEFEWGDIIDHRMFGLGKIIDEPRGPYNDGSWRLEIRWDDEAREDSSVMGSHLRKVSSPKAKGGKYWNNEHKKLLLALIEARGNVERLLIGSFRPPEGSRVQSIRKAHEVEREALNVLISFLEDDEADKHP